MPTSNPVLSNNKKLDYYTNGFVFAKITRPTGDKLPNLFLPFIMEDWSISCLENNRIIWYYI